MARLASGPPESAGAALAERIAADILASQARPGAVVASATELRALHDAGRPVVGQAVRILQERGVAYMRRGAGGGLVVAEPSPAFAGRALSIVIEHDMQSRMDVGPLPMAIDSHLFLDVAPRLDWRACKELRRLARRLDRLPDDEFDRIGAHRKLFNAIRSASGEPALLLAQQASMECAIDLIPYSINVIGEARRGEPWRLNLEILDALISGDTARLFDCRRRQVAAFQASWDAWEEIERNPRLGPKFDDPERAEFQLPGNRADRLAREILREIRLMGWSVGDRIGGGGELMQRYGAGPDVLRQAVLMLQEHSAVRVERGRRGGLYVCEPDRGQALAGAAAYLQRSGATARGRCAFLLRLALEAFDGFPARDAARLRRGAAAAVAWRESGAPDAVRADIWTIAARLCGNPVLQLFTEALAPVSAPPAAPGALDDLLQAVALGDMAKGRRLLLETGRGGLESPAPPGL
jgi:DNA-binding FadR family transcriptional regulator